MFTSPIFQILHETVDLLLIPVIMGLFLLCFWALWEVGVAIGEQGGGFIRLKTLGDLDLATNQGQKRIGNAAILMRLGPMLGLMGTLIPLGPGLAALSRGEFAILAGSITTAFDTTVLGLLIGVVGFLLNSFRRRSYDRLIDQMEAAHES